MSLHDEAPDVATHDEIDNAYLQAARRMYVDEGTLEIDLDAEVSTAHECPAGSSKCRSADEAGVCKADPLVACPNCGETEFFEAYYYVARKANIHIRRADDGKLIADEYDCDDSMDDVTPDFDWYCRNCDTTFEVNFMHIERNEQLEARFE